MGIWLAPMAQRRSCEAGSSAANEQQHPIAGQTSIKTAMLQGRRRPLPCHRRAIRPSIIVAGREPAEEWNGSDGQDRREHHHDVSILIATGIVVGR
jgi:hypothetical protein